MSTTATGFTKPPIFGTIVTVARAVVFILATMVWTTVTVGRLHPAVVAAVPLLIVAVAFVTIYRVATTHWLYRWLAWLRSGRSREVTPWPAAHDIATAGIGIGVVSENEVLTTLIELHPEPLAPTVVTDAEERTANALSITDIARVLTNVLDVKIASADFISSGHRAAGDFADLYQQMTGPTGGPTQRRSWIVIRTGLHDNLAAIDRRGGDTSAAWRLAATTCLRVADTLASSGVDAKPATAETIDDINELLHAEPPTVDHWSHLESRNSSAGIYYADPDHITDDSAQWWTWPLSKDVTTLVRLTPTSHGTQIAALVRYRTDTQPPPPPVSRLGPLYGVQSAMWEQFRIGHLPCEIAFPSAMLGAADPVLVFGPAGPFIGSIGDPRDKTSLHLPLVADTTVLCRSQMLLRRIALLASVTGRPLVVVTDEPDKWKPIVNTATSGAVLTSYPRSWNAEPDATDRDESASATESSKSQPDPAKPEADGQLPAGLDPETILVIDTDDDWPQHIPPATVLTGDDACDADIELVDADDQTGFTFKTRTGLVAPVRSTPGHEERRILGAATPQPGKTTGRRRTPTQPRPAARRAPGEPRPPRPTPKPASPDGQGDTRTTEAPTPPPRPAGMRNATQPPHPPGMQTPQGPQPPVTGQPGRPPTPAPDRPPMPAQSRLDRRPPPFPPPPGPPPPSPPPPASARRPEAPPHNGREGRHRATDSDQPTPRPGGNGSEAANDPDPRPPNTGPSMPTDKNHTDDREKH